MSRFLIGLLMSLFVFGIQASDIAKEKRWAAQIEDSLLDGEAVYLNDGKTDFLAIDTPAAVPGEAAVILLHGIGVHPDWPQVIHPLRVQLPEAGWRTLSLQLPVLPNEADSKDYQPLMGDVPARIEAGIAHLRADGVKTVYIVAHSLGAEMASYYLSRAKPQVTGYVGIGMGPRNARYMENIALPMLDLFGERDLAGVLESAPARAGAGQTNPAYTQRKIPAADHFFDGQEVALLEAVVQWLGKQ